MASGAELAEQGLEVLVGDRLLLVGHRLGSVDQGPRLGLGLGLRIGVWLGLGLGVDQAPEGGLVVGHVFVAHVDEARLVRG